MHIIDEIIRREGGYVDNPNDRGGPTNYGVTQGTLTAWRGRPVSAEDVRDLTEAEAREIYSAQYVLRPGYGDLGEPLRSLMIDSGVQHGPGRATRWLQRSVSVGEDGVIGPMTQAAIAAHDPRDTYTRVVGQRLKYYGDIIACNETQRVFAAGWFRRMADVLGAAKW